MWKVGNVVDVSLGEDFIGYGFNVTTKQGKQLMVFAYETLEQRRPPHSRLKRC
jgi:hypothetical protein